MVVSYGLMLARFPYTPIYLLCIPFFVWLKAETIECLKTYAFSMTMRSFQFFSKWSNWRALGIRHEEIKSFCQAPSFLTSWLWQICTDLEAMIWWFLAGGSNSGQWRIGVWSKCLYFFMLNWAPCQTYRNWLWSYEID